MNKMPEEIVKLAKSGEMKVKTTKPQEVAFAVHKGSYLKLGEVFGKLVQWIEENGYEIVSPSIKEKRIRMGRRGAGARKIKGGMKNGVH